MCILKGFSRFVVSFDVQNGFLFSLSPLNTTVWGKVISFSDISGRGFDCRVEFVSLFNKLIHVFFITVPEGEDIVNTSSPFF